MWTSFSFSNSLENPESNFKKKSQFYTVYWWQSSCTTQLTLSYIGKKKQKREKEKKRLAGTKKVYWCIHQIQKTNRKLASRKISNNSQWGDNFSEEEVAFLRLIHIFYKELYPSDLHFMFKQLLINLWVKFTFTLWNLLTLTINHIPKSTGWKV